MKFNRRNRDRHESSSGLARPHLNWNSAIKTMIADDEQKNRSYSFQHLKTRFPDMRGLADSINRGVFHVVNYTMNKCLLLLKKKEKKKEKKEEQTRWYTSQQFYLGFSYSSRGESRRFGER